jgi:hypothetical protein
MLDDGSVERRVRLLRPMERASMALAALEETNFRPPDLADISRTFI